MERRLRPIERELENALRKIIARWGERVLDRLNRAAQGRPVVQKAIDSGDIDGIIGDPDSLFKEIDRALAGAVFEATRAGYGAFQVIYDIPPPKFDLLDPAVRAMMENLTTMSKYVTDYTIDRLRQVMTEGIKEGVPEEELGYRVRDAINVRVAQARRIARTEMAKVYNSALQNAAAEANRKGLLDVKTWITAADRRVRPAHRAAHGQTVPINEPFVVGGERMMQPGDPNASVSNVVNCRCTVAYDLEERP